ncbi:MAG: PAS domain S-box protein [Calothrix sp. MO_167.B12]|nr:PAS domain S-box protein [Calothrix sp. MO_167.B12]
MYSLHNISDIFPTFLEYIPTAVAAFDMEMRCLTHSHSWLKDYGLETQSVIGKSYYDVFPQTSAQWKKIHQKCLNGSIESGEADCIICADGSIKWVNWKIVPWRDRNQKITGIIFFSELITKQNQIELQIIKLQKTAALSHKKTIQLQKLAANLPEMIFQLVMYPDGEQSLSYVSPACRELYEVESEYAEKDINWIYALIHPIDLPEFEKSILVSAQTLKPLSIEHRIITPSGKWKCLQVQARPEKQENGNIVWDGMVMDITERKQIEEDLQKFVSLVDNSSDFICIATLDNKAWYINEAGLKLVGLNNLQQFQTTVMFDYHSPEDWEYFQQVIAPVVMETGRWQGEYRLKHFQTGELIPVDYTIFLVKDQNTNKPIAFAIVTRDITERKNAELALRISEAKYREIASREKLLNRLSSQIRESLDLDTVLDKLIQELRELLQVNSCSFSWLQPDSNSHCWKTIKEAKTPDVPSLLDDISAELPYGKRNVAQFEFVIYFLLKQEIFKIDDINDCREPIYRQFLENLGIKSEIMLPIKTYSQRIGVITCSHWSQIRPWSDSEVELLEAVVDQLAITINQAELYSQSQETAAAAQQQTKELEKTLQKLQKTQIQLIQNEKMSSLGQLVAGLAHEINNPVNFIYGNLEHTNAYIEDVLGLLNLYQRIYRQPQPEIRELIEEIDLDYIVSDFPQLISSMKMGSERIQKIVRSLRTFSRLDEAEMKKVDIHEGIESTLMILQHRLKPKQNYPGIKIIKNYSVIPHIVCYPGQLNQVFLNLLTNAIDALEDAVTDDELLIPTITIGTKLIDNHHIAIHIADNGLGMTPEVKQKLFDPFFTTKPVGVGTGLGLSVSYQIIVDKHHGQISFSTEREKGSEFIIEIPVLQPNHT